MFDLGDFRSFKFYFYQKKKTEMFRGRRIGFPDAAE